MKTTPVKGTNDYLPREAELRDFIQGKILQTYKKQGFNRIYTPILEDITNLEKSDGGENLNLIYKILKRGDKLAQTIENKDFDNLSDLGLRYDLTLPLTRFYSNNKEKLPTVFKCIQIDKVYRAERPQKGRDRELVQCDIDILGSDSPNCEIELIDTTATALLNVGLTNFKIKINDRRVLKSLLTHLGFGEEQLNSVCITFDKLDKIGADGIASELSEKGFDKTAIDNLVKLLAKLPITLEDVKSICGDMPEIQQLEYIISSVKKVSEDKYGIYFDVSLVRGQGYYTGTIFEIESEDFYCSVGGGGRYDNLVEKFTGISVPAVGFSIGFERIFSILNEKQFNIFDTTEKLALICNKEDFVDALIYSKTLNANYNVSIFEKPNKLGKLLNKLAGQGFGQYCIFDEKLIKELKEF